MSRITSAAARFHTALRLVQCRYEERVSYMPFSLIRLWGIPSRLPCVAYRAQGWRRNSWSAVQGPEVKKPEVLKGAQAFTEDCMSMPNTPWDDSEKAAFCGCLGIRCVGNRNSVEVRANIVPGGGKRILFILFFSTISCWDSTSHEYFLCSWSSLSCGGWNYQNKRNVYFQPYRVTIQKAMQLWKILVSPLCSL